MEREERLYPISEERFTEAVLWIIEASYRGKGRPPEVSHYKVFRGILYTRYSMSYIFFLYSILQVFCTLYLLFSTTYLRYSPLYRQGHSLLWIPSRYGFALPYYGFGALYYIGPPV
jgi:hypothetical protein